MEHANIEEKISIEQATQKLKEHCIEWVDTELSSGIKVPAHYWKGGHYKQILSMIIYRSIIIPYILFTFVMVTLLIQEWKVFGILAGVAAIYMLCGKLLHRRNRMNFLLSCASLTIVQGRKNMMIPWKNVKNISYVAAVVHTGIKKHNRYYKVTKGIAYEIKIQSDNKYYNFYDLYEHDLLFDENRNTNLPALPLHIICVLMQTAWNKVR